MRSADAVSEPGSLSLSARPGRREARESDAGPGGLAPLVLRAVADGPGASSSRRRPAAARPRPPAAGGCAVPLGSAWSAKGACRQLTGRVLTRMARSGSAWLVAGGVRDAVQTARERCRWLAGRRKPGSIRSGRDPVRTDVSRVFIPARRLSIPAFCSGCVHRGSAPFLAARYRPVLRRMAALNRQRECMFERALNMRVLPSREAVDASAGRASASHALAAQR